MAAVFRVIPQFALGDGLMNMSFMQVCTTVAVHQYFIHVVGQPF